VASDATAQEDEELSGQTAVAGLTCSADTRDVDSDRGGRVVVEVLGLPKDAEVWCELSIAWDGWVLSGGEERAHRLTINATRRGATQVVCEVPPSPEAAEGPVNLQVGLRPFRIGRDTALPPCGAMDMWYSARLVASFGESPYYAAAWGELLVRTNASSAGGSALRLRATAPDGRELVSSQVTPQARTALNVSFAGVDASFDGMVKLELFGPGPEPLVERSVRLCRVPERWRGRSAVDHKRRALLVDGRPFFSIGWFSIYLHFGEAAAITSLQEMARDGVNSVMLYNLIGGPPGTTVFRGRGKAPASPKPILDAAQALGIKVQVYLLDITRPLTHNQTKGWAYLEEVVDRWRHHPAVLGWYVADDSAGPLLPEVYRRIKQVDPHHIVTMAIAGSGDSVRSKYLRGSDIIMVETYPRTVDYAYATMNVVSRWPLEFMPSLTCGRAWTKSEDDGVFTVGVFRSQLYHALIAGTTGELWFAYRNAEGWNQPGLPLRAASFEATGQLLELAPALASPVGFGAIHVPSVTVAASLVAGEVAAPTAVRARAFHEETGCVMLLLANSLNEPVKAVVTFAYGSAGIYDQKTNVTQALVPFELALPRRRVPVKRGILVEYLPALGTQAFQLNGTSDCAVVELAQGVLERPNLILNPSFEQFGAYVSAPLYWDCSMTPLNLGSNCFADASVCLDRRHSGRFVTGLNVQTFEIAPSIGWSKELPEVGTYVGSIWAQAGVPMSLVVGRRETTFQEVARADLTDAWRELTFEVRLERNSRLVFKVNATGVLWLDSARLVLRSPV